MSKISFCVTYYNQQDFVQKSLDSILAIDFPCDFEILCGDDGSVDGTLDVIKKYAKKYPDIFKYFVTDRKETAKSINRASMNRINLAKNATGDYVMFLDGDDFYCDTGFIKNALKIFNDNPSVTTCAFNYKLLNTDNTETLINQQINEGLISNRFYISNGLYTHSGACVFKNVLLDKNKLNYLTEINNFDDNAITIYMLQFGNLYYINKSIYEYRQSNDSLWNGFNEIEQAMINAMDYKLISDTAPMFKSEIAKRQYHALKHLFKNRKCLKSKLGDKYEKYLSLVRTRNDSFLEKLLLWDCLNFSKKLSTFIDWLKLKLLVKKG